MENLKLLFFVLILLKLFSCNSENKPKKIDSVSIETSPHLANKVNSELNNELRDPSYEGEEQVNTKFCYPTFDIIFYDYSFQETRRNQSDSGPEYPSDPGDTLKIRFVEKNGEFFLYPKLDTLELVEDVSSDLGTTLMQIIPKNKSDIFKVSFSFKEKISEQFDDRKLSLDNYKSRKEYDEAVAKWETDKVQWERWTSFQYLKDSLKYFFKMPPVREEDYEKELKIQFGLRDTLVDLSGEGIDGYSNVATLIYKNKPCYFGLSDGLIKIERFANGNLVETKYISIWINSGC